MLHCDSIGVAAILSEGDPQVVGSCIGVDSGCAIGVQRISSHLPHHLKLLTCRTTTLRRNERADDEVTPPLGCVPVDSTIQGSGQIAVTYECIHNRPIGSLDPGARHHLARLAGQRGDLESFL